MTLDEYQELVHRTAKMDPAFVIETLTLSMVTEMGGFAKRASAMITGDHVNKHTESEAVDKLGNMLWLIAELSNELGWSLERIALDNLKKMNRAKDAEAL